KFEEVSPITSVSINLDSEHEGTLAITKDGNTIYFTRNDVAESERSHDVRGTSNLNLYRAIRVDKIWREVEKLDLNVEGHSTGHPALSPDEKTLYFVSDRPHPEAMGETDIYKVEIYGNGQFGPVINLGDKVNTVHREMFPFVAKDSTLYFSSDGHTTGLLDIFKSDILKETLVNERKNLGAKFNSLRDDFAFFINEDGKSGYFSSNRAGGIGGDDIYSFVIGEECNQIVSGITKSCNITDITDTEPLSNVVVVLVDESGTEIARTTSNDKGEYMFENLECNKTFNITGSKEKYINASEVFNSTSENGFRINQDLCLNPVEIKIDRILFDFDKATITAVSQLELDKLVRIMNDYENMKIAIESHTDLRGSRAYNENLSIERAESTYNYLVNIGKIDASRLTRQGFGECLPLIRCGNYCDERRPNLNRCTDDQRDQNRRSVFRITNPNDIQAVKIYNFLDDNNKP
ncbi:MAG: PD40 domain-containing protein, partial [Bacteroidia bacterium]|nr:PD40 domain-containing protein [Bacteroidia bacterium]